MSTILTKLGRFFFAIPLIVFAIEYLARGRWLGGMPPVPPWTHGEHIFSYVTGAALLVLGISLLINKEARLSATILGLLFMFSVVFLHAARHFSGIIHDGNIRTRAFETLALGGAAFVLAALVSKGSSIQFLSSVNPLLAVIGRYIYAFSMVIFGIQHYLLPRTSPSSSLSGCLPISSSPTSLAPRSSPQAWPSPRTFSRVSLQSCSA